MVQVSVFFSPGTGIDMPRQIANRLAESIVDGTMLDSGTIYESGVVNPVIKSKSGWFIPVHFYGSSRLTKENTWLIYQWHAGLRTKDLAELQLT